VVFFDQTISGYYSFSGRLKSLYRIQVFLGSPLYAAGILAVYYYLQQQINRIVSDIGVVGCRCVTVLSQNHFDKCAGVCLQD